MISCTDTDLLALEPWIFRDAAFASQLLSSGTGGIAGTAFTRSAGSFADEQVAAGAVLCLSGDLTGCFPIVAVSSATQATVSILHETLFDEAGQPVPVGTASNLTFAVRTFGPQRRIVSELLRAAAGVGPGTDLPDGQLLPTPALRHVTAMGTFQLIYSALAAAAGEPAELQRRADYYEALYRKALGRLLVEIDADGDGQADLVRLMGVVELRRG
jgi:hypothetical protein